MIATAKSSPVQTLPKIGEGNSLPAWPLGAAFALYPVCWALGASWLTFPVAALLMVPLLLAERAHARVPPGFGWYALFLLATPVTLLTGHGALATLYRGSTYFAAGVFFLYAYNMQYAVRRAARYLTVFWGVSIVGGFIGTVAPDLSIRTPLHAMVGSTGYLASITSAKFASISSAFGTPRPCAPFFYSNMWGAVIAMTVPAVVAFILKGSSIPARVVVTVLALLAVVPVVYSLDRSLWAALGFFASYVIVRALRRGNIGTLGAIVATIAVGLSYLATSWLGELITSKLSYSETTAARSEIYSATLSAFQQSPWVGNGPESANAWGTQALAGDIGTQGQFWMLLYAGGLIMTVPFYLWLLRVLVTTMHAGSREAAAFRLAVVSGLGLTFVYSLVPAGMVVLATCAAALLRASSPDATP